MNWNFWDSSGKILNRKKKKRDIYLDIQGNIIYTYSDSKNVDINSFKEGYGWFGAFKGTKSLVDS